MATIGDASDYNHGLSGHHGHGSHGSSTSPSARDKLYEGLSRSADQTTSYLDSLKATIAGYDREHKLSDSAAATWDQEIQRASRAVDDMKRMSEDFRSKGNDVSDDMVNSASTAVDDMMKNLNGLADRVNSYEHSSTPAGHPSKTDKMKIKAEKVKEKLFGPKHSTQDSLVDTMNSTRETTWSGYDQLKRELTSARNTAATHATNAKDKLVEGAQTVKSNVASGVDKAKTKASEGADKVKGKSEDAAHKTKKSAGIEEPTMGEKFTDGTKNLVGASNPTEEPSTKDKIVGGAQDMKDTTKSKAQDATHETKKTAGVEEPTMTEKIVGGAKNLMGMSEEPSTTDKAVGGAKDAKDTTKAKAQDATHETKKTAGIEEPTMTEKIIGGAKNLVGMSDPTQEPSTTDKVVGSAKDTKDSAKSKAQDATHETKKTAGIEEPTMTEKIVGGAKNLVGMSDPTEEPSTTDKVVGSAKDAKDTTKAKAQDATHETKKSAGIEEPTMTEKIVGGAKNLVGMSDPTQEPSTTDKMVGGAKDMKDSAKAKTDDAAHGAKKSVGVEEPTMTEKAKNALNSSLDYVADTLHGWKVESTSGATPTDKRHSITSDSPVSALHP